ncbi:xanthine dehydrogenase family protein molybdopterin-binding subunit [Humitalea sp. 24SJ18S-53]|uniref:xanthine dehydrogenase family protein molybdopterin-binding subunit n=1 Tax=Humitalea sp. 24SJ18S-53 TaxID=3422307 RepID=UPI003D67ECA5
MADRFGHPARRPRREDDRLLRGLGHFTADLVPSDALRLHVLRSPHAHARIAAIDISQARAMPGVLAIVTGADLEAAGLGTIPCVSRPRDATGRPRDILEPPHRILATDRVRHVGDAVVAIVATSRIAALDAAEAVEVDYEPLDAVTDTALAGSPDAPRLWPDVPDNCSFIYDIGDAAAARQAMASAHHVTRLRLVNQRVHASPIEPRVAIGAWDEGAKRWHLTVPSQMPHQVRSVLANTVLKVPERQLRVTSPPDVGGGFGLKGGLFREYALVLWLARRLRRTIAWIGDRSESFVADDHARDNVTEAALALDEQGRFLAITVETDAAIGAMVALRGAHSMTNNLGSLAGVYATPVIHARVRGLFSNTAPTAPYRGAGRPEATYVVERLIDAAAAEMGLDRIALRHQNLIPKAAIPFQTALLFNYDSGDFARGMALAESAADLAGFPARRAASEAQGKLRGLGLINAIEQAGGPFGSPAEERADIRFEPDGGILLTLGTAAAGQGHETVFARMLAEHLGVAEDSIRVVQGDTDLVAFGRGTFGSRSVAAAGSALAQAADKVVAKGRLIAAHLLEAAEADLVFQDGAFAVEGTDLQVTFAEVLRTAFAPTRLPQGLEPGLDQAAIFAASAPTYPNGCHVCEVEIDPETGMLAIQRYIVADDVGTVVDHAMLEGQVQGGVAQGIGQALMEQILHDPVSGQLLTASFMDYAMPRAADIPPVTLLDNPQPTPVNPLGAKGGGEAGTIGAPPTVICAILDALAPFGITHIDMPATPERIWRALHATRSTSSPVSLEYQA